MEDARGAESWLRREVTVRRVVGALTGTAALIAAGKTIATETTGAELVPGQFLYYVAAATVWLYLSVMIGLLPALAGAWLSENLAVAEKRTRPVTVPVGVALGIVAALGLAQAGVLFDWREANDVARTIFALFGLLCLAIPAWVVARQKV